MAQPGMQNNDVLAQTLKSAVTSGKYKPSDMAKLLNEFKYDLKDNYNPEAYKYKDRNGDWPKEPGLRIPTRDEVKDLISKMKCACPKVEKWK
jgi:hypothetical protein